MTLRRRVERLEAKQRQAATEDPRTRDLCADLRAEERRRTAMLTAYLNLARRMWERAGQPERAAALTLDNVGGQMESALCACGPRFRLALRVAAQRLLDKERAGQISTVR